MRILQRVNVEPNQTNLIVSLQSMLQAAGLILVCPDCQAEGKSEVTGDVAADTPVWHLNCGCRERLMERKDARHLFDADGELMASAETVLQPVRLSVRCPEPRCVRHPLEMTRVEKGMEVRCRCAKTTFRILSQTAH